MWTEIFLLITVAVMRIRARIDGLQNDPGTGYTYSQPEERGLSSTIQASVAYYVNIPANHESVYSNQYIQYPSQYRMLPPQDLRANSIYHGFPQQYSQPLPEPDVPLPSEQDLRGISHFNPYEQLDTTRHNVYQRPPPSLQYHQYRQHPSNHFPQPTYQFDPRSHPHNPLPLPTNNYHTSPNPQHSGYRFQQSIVEHLSSPSFRNSPNQDYRPLQSPSQELIPPPYTPHVTLQIEPKSFVGSSPKQYRIVPSVASLPMSYNAQLPFPIGIVPIRFRPLPLKTHLRQAGLLPITSYQARESYRK